MHCTDPQWEIQLKRDVLVASGGSEALSTLELLVSLMLSTLPACHVVEVLLFVPLPETLVPQLIVEALLDLAEAHFKSAAEIGGTGRSNVGLDKRLFVSLFVWTDGR